jgi:HEPN domain-containing protein
MAPRDALLAVAREWLAKADNDLKAAAYLLKLGRHCPTDVACFHAQQCVEKCLKAMLVLLGTNVPKTHDLEALTRLLPQGLRPELDAPDLAAMTLYATGARYPGWTDVPLAEARRAVSRARRVRSGARAAARASGARPKRRP